MRNRTRLMWFLCALSEGQWRSITKRMTWLYRQPEPTRIDMPWELQEVFARLPTEDEWNSTRKDVSESRAAKRLANKRLIERQRAARRREYMRNYRNTQKDNHL